MSDDLVTRRLQRIYAQAKAAGYPILEGPYSDQEHRRLVRWHHEGDPTNLAYKAEREPPAMTTQARGPRTGTGSGAQE